MIATELRELATAIETAAASENPADLEALATQAVALLRKAALESQTQARALNAARDGLRDVECEARAPSGNKCKKNAGHTEAHESRFGDYWRPR